MKKLIIAYIETDSLDVYAVADRLSVLPANAIDLINWPDEYPSRPEVFFRIAHSGDNILLQYQVREDEILGMVTEDNGEVWTDSCAEFFVTFDDANYYNLESNCIGRVLLGYRKTGERAEHALPEIMKSIKRLPDLGFGVRSRQKGDFKWTLTLIIPIATFWKSNIKTLRGIKARGNFYKCGDNLTVPHFVSWAKIETPNPNFHQPGFFGELIFE